MSVDSVDVVVIGAGLGGLSVATRLAQKGQKVLLLERHNIPGGYATSFVRGRYEFEVALHELSGVGSEGNWGGIYHYLKSCGVAKRLEFVQTPTLYRSIFSDHEFSLPTGWDAAESALCAAFPDDADGICRFLKLVRDITNELLSLRMSGLHKLFRPKTLAQMPRKYPNLLRYNMACWGPVLRRFVKSSQARAVLSQFWGYFGLPPERCSFFFFAIGLGTYLGYGASYVKGRSQSLSNAFVEAFEEHGGEARFGCGAKKILMRCGRVSAVITDRGDTVPCRFVVSNADPMVTCRELLPQDAVPRSFFGDLTRRKLGPSSVNVYLGVNRSPDQLGITDHEIFINGSDDFEQQYRDCHGLGPASCLAVTCYNHVQPDISPPGTSMVVLTTLKYGDAWRSLRPGDYLKVKHRHADHMIGMTERIAPDIRKYTEAIEVSTPLTNVRYGGAYGGSIYGWGPTPSTHTVWSMPPKGPVPGLFFAGAWTQPGGGFEPAMISGSMTAGRVLWEATMNKGKGPREASA